MSFHKCRSCGIKFDCGYGDPCSSKYKKIDCPSCYKKHVKGLICLISSKNKIILGKIEVLKIERFKNGIV